jgi:hypothetical protein
MSTCSRSNRGTGARRRAVVDGVRRSLATGFVYTGHDLSTDLLDTTYGMLPSSFGRRRDQAAVHRAGLARPDRLHRPARRDGGIERQADWKEMLNWSAPIPPVIR